jgi:EAL domain-containing protein (putative c-di-GMP-specific phosphodiesterase class I)
MDFTMAFQPIVDLEAGKVWGYEALVRGASGEPAGAVLSQVTEENRYRFDQSCRVKAIEAAGRLFEEDSLKLSINFMPNAVYEPAACIRTSLAAAERVGLARTRLMFEFTEQERVVDIAHLSNIIESYKRFGFITAVDDFGAGHAGLNLLADLHPDLLKLDMDLIRGIDSDRRRQVIASGVCSMAQALGITILAEGVETEAEARTLRGMGLSLMQGYLFARPEIQRLPPVALPSPTLAAVA